MPFSTVTRTTVRTIATATSTVVETATATISNGQTVTTTATTGTITNTATTTSGTVSLGAETTITTILNKRLKKRQSARLALPSYASSICAYSGYPSACICLGITRGGTTYIEVPTVTEVVTHLATLTQQLSKTETSLTTVTTTQTDTVNQEATKSALVIKPQFTSFALQTTDDERNGDFKGQWLQVISSDFSIALTAAAAQAAMYLSDFNGNVTSSTGAKFAVDPSATGAQMYQRATQGTEVQAGCWVDANLFFQCRTANKQFFGADNSTKGLEFHTYQGAIYPNGNTGPLIIKAVAFPAPGATTRPPAAAKAIVIRAKPVAENEPFSGQFWSTGNDGTRFPRVTFVAAQAGAIALLADPVTGSITEAHNIPFVANHISQIEQFYLSYPADTKDIIAGTVDWSDLSVSFFHPGSPGSSTQQFAGFNQSGANMGAVGIYNDTSIDIPTAYPNWVGPIILEAVLV
ncbi:hypothetical protein ABW20_dc0109595 [Dactylellina cionopaga]|nr:hypothetical protein ABW20_dc0109595 [Dactylellina cionopaga]